MKKMLLMAAILGGTAAMSAQVAMVKPKFTDNWSIGLDGGVTTPLNDHGAFFGNMRGVAGLHIQKQITPVFGVGAEGLWGVNTSSWRGLEHSKTAFDSQYVGVYGAVNLFDLFSSNYNLGGRVFDIEAQAGAGWGHYFQSKYTGVGDAKEPKDHNFFATKAGLNFNFHPSQRVTLSLKPSVLWNMSDAHSSQSSASYDSRKATFNLLASVSVALGNGFEYVVPNYNLDEIAALNDQVNSLKADLNGAATALTAANAANAALQNEVNKLKNQKPEIVKTTTTNDYLQSVRYVNFALGRYNVPADQLPNVAAVASYLKNQPKSTVVIKGYASADGPVEVNERLARQRAESVRDMLIKKYGIAADRIKAEGEGIGHMFEEESWNRVAICTLDNNAPVSSDSQTVVKK
ncbi:MAG: OmpA family protein [Bacteroides sp.]|nr:OmpA family protein [Bacteroides sp.]